MITIQFKKGWDAHIVPHFLLQHINREKMLSKILHKFDSAGYIAAMLKTPNPINPFNIANHYCVKVNGCNDDGPIQLNLSPVFPLCVTYPDSYAQKYGKRLNPHAVLGLVEDSHSQDYPAFSLIIDAGMAFDSIKNNRSACLYFDTDGTNITVTFNVLQEKRELQFQWHELQLNFMNNTETQMALCQKMGDI